jgi:hypothetical protein
VRQGKRERIENEHLVLDWIRVSREQVVKISVGALSLVASVSGILLHPIVQTLSPGLKLVAAVVGGGSFYAIYSMIETALNHWRLRALRGPWLYVTYPHPGTVDSPIEGTSFGYGYMNFAPKPGGDLDYTVNLFRTREDLEMKARGELGGSPIGRATSNAARFDGTTINLIYTAKYGTDKIVERQGKLILDADEAPRRLTGTWASDPWAPGTPIRRTLSAGRMIAVRLQDFHIAVREAYEDCGLPVPSDLTQTARVTG